MPSCNGSVTVNDKASVAVTTQDSVSSDTMPTIITDLKNQLHHFHIMALGAVVDPLHKMPCGDEAVLLEQCRTGCVVDRDESVELEQPQIVAHVALDKLEGLAAVAFSLMGMVD